MKIFCKIGDFEVTLLKIIAQINKQALGFSKIHSFCYMINFSRLFKFRTYRVGKKNSELQEHRGENSTLNPSFHCSVCKSYV